MNPVDPYLAIKTNPQYLAYAQLVILLEDYAKQIGAFPEVGSSDAFDQAIREITVPTVTDLIAIRELVRLGFGSTAETLLRTQIERVATISFLRSNPNKILRWAKIGGDIEKLKVRIDFMDALRNPLGGKIELSEIDFREQLKKYVDGLNALVHCNRAGAYNSSFENDTGTFLVAGSNPYNAQQISRVCNYAGQVLCYLVQELNLQYPKLKDHYLGKAA